MQPLSPVCQCLPPSPYSHLTWRLMEQQAGAGGASATAATQDQLRPRTPTIGIALNSDASTN